MAAGRKGRGYDPAGREAEDAAAAGSMWWAAPVCRRWLYVLFTCGVLVAVVYGPFLSAPFFFDDFHAVANNPFIRRLSNIGGFFADPASGSFHGRYLAYRPVLLLTYALSYALTGPAPWSFRLINLLLHALNGSLVFLLLRRLLDASGSVRFAFFGTLVFLLHPAQTQAVMYVNSRSELLAATFVLAAVVGFLDIQNPRAGAGGGRIAWPWIAAGGAFCLALFTKASAALFFPAALLVGLAASPRLDRPRVCKIALSLIPFAVLYLLHRWLKRALIAAAAARIHQLGPLMQVPHPGSDLLLRIEAFAVYPRLLLIPYPLSVFHQLPQDRWATLLAAASLLLLAAMLVGAVVTVGKRRLVALALAWFPAMLVPYFFVFLNLKVNEHRLYLALVALSVLVADQLRRSPTRRNMVAVAVLLALYAAGTVTRDLDWADRERFWRHEAAVSPDLPWPYEKLTAIYDSQGRRAEAREAFRQATIRDGVNPGFVHHRRGMLAVRAGRTEEAREEFRRAVEHDPFKPSYLNDLGSILDDLGRTAEAERVLRRALELTPCFAEAHFNLGVVLARTGKTREAEESIRRAVECDPYYGKARAKFGAILLSRGEYADALRHLERAAVLPSPASWVFYNLAVARARAGMREPALDALERAAGAGFDDLRMASGDPAFEALRELPRFRSLMSTVAVGRRDAGS